MWALGLALFLPDPLKDGVVFPLSVCNPSSCLCWCHMSTIYDDTIQFGRRSMFMSCAILTICGNVMQMVVQVKSKRERETITPKTIQLNCPPQAAFGLCLIDRPFALTLCTTPYPPPRPPPLAPPSF